MSTALSKHTIAHDNIKRDANTAVPDDEEPRTVFATADPASAEKDPDALEQQLPCTNSTKHNRNWRKVVRNFPPSFFTITMGTGITSILLHNLPYNAYWLQYISYIIFALNVILFVLFTLVSVVRYALYPEIWVVMIKHPAQSLFLGCYPMALATIINMICFVCVPAWGGDWWKLAWALWWIDVALSVSTCCYLPFAIMANHKVSLPAMTAAWLLPIVSTVVASASGAVVAGILPHTSYQLITVITSYVLWGQGVSLAMVVLVIYFLRLTTHHLPAKEVIVSTFLPLGPLGQGGFAIQQLGNVTRELFHETNTLPASTVYAGDILYVVGFLIAIIMWGFGLVWFFFALASILRTERFPFNMGWWGFTFPLGVFAVSTTTLAKELPSAFFKIVGTALSVAVVLLWLVVSGGTLYKVWTGEVFVAPCLKDLGEDEACGRRRRRRLRKKKGDS